MTFSEENLDNIQNYYEDLFLKIDSLLIKLKQYNNSVTNEEKTVYFNLAEDIFTELQNVNCPFAGE